MVININKVDYHLFIRQQDEALPSLLLLHGFMGSGKVFEHLLDGLCEFVNPITLDLLGHGKTTGPGRPERFSVRNQIDDLHQIISSLDLNHLFLHGYSMGGRLALLYALKYPGQPAGLILESSNYGVERKEANQRIKLDEERAIFIEKDFTAFLEEWKKLPLFNKGIDIDPALSSKYHAIQQSQNPAYMAASLRGSGAAQMPPVKDSLPQLNLPVLLMAGENDKKYCEIISGMHHLIRNSKFCIIPNAGHRIHLEHPSAFISELESFITLIRPGNSRPRGDLP